MAFVGLDLAEHEVLLLFAAVALDSPFQQRDGNGKAMQAGPYIFDHHRCFPKTVACRTIDDFYMIVNN